MTSPVTTNLTFVEEINHRLPDGVLLRSLLLSVAVAMPADLGTTEETFTIKRVRLVQKLFPRILFKTIIT